MNPELPLRRVAIIGVGLVGGSFALALRKAHPDVFLAGSDADAKALAFAKANHVIDQALEHASEAAADADLVVIATPLVALPAVFGAIATTLSDAALVIDVASTKESVVAAARAHLGAALSRFVPCHPIAGSEQSGVAAARADLFDERPVVITPLDETAPPALRLVRALWMSLGAVCHEMAPGAHDRLYAYLSHAPHLLAFGWMALAARTPRLAESFELSGSGFRDFTRIAASSAALWADIVIDNRAAIAELLEQHVEGVTALREALLAGDRAHLLAVFGEASRLRRSLP